MRKIKGIILPLITPFSNDGSKIDIPALRELVSYFLETGIHGLFLAGTTGEGPSLTLDERKQVFDTCLEEVAGRISIIAQITSLQANQALQLTQYTSQLPVDGLAIMTPWFYTLQDDILTKYVESIATVSRDKPLFLYNFPQRTTNTFKHEQVLILKDKIKTIAGIKESGSFEMLEKWAKIRSDTFTPLCGIGYRELDAYKIGIRAVVSSFANVYPKLFARFHDIASAEQWDEAAAIQEELNQKCQSLDNNNLITNVKNLMHQQGLPSGSSRLPFS